MAALESPTPRPRRPPPRVGDSHRRQAVNSLPLAKLQLAQAGKHNAQRTLSAGAARAFAVSRSLAAVGHQDDRERTSLYAIISAPLSSFVPFPTRT